MRFSSPAALFAIIVPLCTFANVYNSEPNCPEGKERFRMTFRHIESGGIGYQEGYTTFEAFLASDPSQSSYTPFLDLRAHIFDNGTWASNIGIGLRTLWGNRAYGINTYYDHRHTRHLNANQIALGLETLGEVFDFRINGYLPLGAKNSGFYSSPAFAGFSGNYLLISRKMDSVMKGADAEFGFHFGHSKWLDFYAAAGPYYFIGKKTPATWGGKGRIATMVKEILTLEISDSYDRTFHNKFQGLIGLTFSFGPKTKVKEQERSCTVAHTLNACMLQPVNRQEIIVIDQKPKKTPAIDPGTGEPYFFVFVDNTSSSNGTYESPYHTLTQAQSGSSTNDIIYVFPGDGTTTGMERGITLKANQKLWGSGVSHLLTTSAGTVSIPSQTSSSPTITNTDFDTLGHAVILATNNAISGLTINAPLTDAIYGTNAENLEVSSCTFTNTSRYPINASFSGNASISVTNNQFLSNANGVSLTLNGTSTLVLSNNDFQSQTSPSNVPIEIAASNNTFSAEIENNIFNDNETGSVRANLGTVVNATMNLLNNRMTNNRTGSQSSLGSNIAILATGTTNNCSITLTNNTLSGNTSHALYMHTDGAMTTLSVTASSNTMSNNGGSGLVLATPVTNLTLLATGNTISQSNDNGIAVIASGTTTTGDITINNNTITDIGNDSNGIAVNQNFTTLDLTLSNNNIDNCAGTGILSYAGTGIQSFTLDVSDNTISNCDNGSSNAASGLDIEQYTNLAASVTANTLSSNAGTAVYIGSTLTAPTSCLTFTGNSSSNYTLSNPGDGTFNVSPCDALTTGNTGTVTTSGVVNSITSCPDGDLCPP